MRLIFNSSKAKEVLLNLEILTTNTSDHKEQIRLRLIRQWYLEWFNNPQNEDHYKTWSQEWSKLVSKSRYRFPLPEKNFKRNPKVKSKTAYLRIKGENYPLSHVRIYPVEKQFLNKSLIVQKSQSYVSFAGQATNEHLVVVSVKDKGDFLVPYPELQLRREL